MPSEVEIVSMSLNSIGAESITSFDDGSKRANLCRDFYPNIRDAVLRAYPWNCATERMELGLEAAGPEYEYAYKFQLPTDPYCLRVLEVEDDYDYRIEGRYLLSDNSTIKIKFIKRITDSGLFDSLLMEAIVARLAAALVIPIAGAGNASLVEGMWKLYEAKIREARTTDGMEGTIKLWQSNALTDCR